MSAEGVVYLKIKRQSGPKEKPYWEEFALKYSSNDTLLGVLLKLKDNPITVGGKHTTPVHYEYNCKEEACGTCTILVNGRPRMSCSTLVSKLPLSSQQKPIVLEPLEKFPVVKDLTVNRKRLFRSLSKVKNWVETDEIFEPQIKYNRDKQLEMYSYSKCINCGSCYEACPRTDRGGGYMGPAAISNVVVMCNHPLGKEDKKERLQRIMGEDGISKCGKASACEAVCPKCVPLLRSIASANRLAIKKMLHLP